MASASLTPIQAYLQACKAEGLPSFAHLDITYRCELDCQHCYLDNRTTWPEMTTTEWIAVLDQLAAMRTLQLKWSGGDVRQRVDFERLLVAAAQRGFINRVKTHAGRVTAEVAQVWAGQRVDQVDVSVYSLDATKHDTFTRRPGSLAATLAGIDHLRSVGLPVQVSVSVVDLNVDDMSQLWQHFTAKGCRVVYSLAIRRDHSATTHLDVLNLSPDNRRKAETQLWQLEKSAIAAPPALGADPCGAGRSLVYISPDGGVWPCVAFPMQLGQVREQPLAEIWNNSVQRQALAAWTNKDRVGCHTCAGNGLCFYCAGEAYKATGDFKIAPPHFHTRTLHAMQGYEAARGPTFSPAQWASVPVGGAHPPRTDKFVFPIYRPRKGQGARAGKPAP